jgi:hypothetical protein
MISSRRLKKIVYKFLPAHTPYFLILGAQKSGTTSLHFYLNQHPLLVGSRPKELEYFTVDSIYEKGEVWYTNQFKSHKSLLSKKLYFESTPDYLYRSYVPERIYRFKKDLKFVIILREPVSRAYSAWNMHRDFLLKRKELPLLIRNSYMNGREHNSFKELYKSSIFPDFETCIASEFEKIENSSVLEEPSFIRKGIYIEQVERYFKYFDPSKFLFLGMKELSRNKVATLNRILNFLELKEYDWNIELLPVQHKRSYDADLNPKTSTLLQEFYAPYNNKLFSKIGSIDW